MNLMLKYICNLVVYIEYISIVNKTKLDSIVKKSVFHYNYIHYFFMGIHATGKAFAGGKANQQNRQRKMEKFVLYITTNGHNLYTFAGNNFYIIKK